MISLKDLYADASTRKVLLRGREIVLTEPTAAQMAVLRQAFPRPVAPMGADPAKGSLAPPVPNEADSDHRAKVVAWTELYTLVEVALAMGYATKDGATFTLEPKAAAAWGEAAGAELMTLPRRELSILIEGCNAFGEEDAAGNSSAPPPSNTSMDQAGPHGNQDSSPKRTL